MEYLYLGIILFLCALAVFDLVVGVSNDAVNFLNSAIGSKTAKFKTIMIIAAIGVFAGAALSNGMMDVARHGIFQPSFFHFNEIIVILLAVMVTDVVLLDIFNSMGMPTSTTVSMVFELLGGTVAIAMLKNLASDGALKLTDMINTDKALTVILGIFLAIAIAFFFGALIQYISRLIFTFKYKKYLNYFAGIFGGIAITAIFYFMIIKGLKGAPFIPKEFLLWVKTNTPLLLTYCFLGFGILMQILHWLKVNILKVIVLVGTFSLAMAFAGNDLVNFIGVPLTGLDAYNDYVANGLANGIAPGAYTMDILNESAKTPIYYLIGAGVIMVLALMTSKKAKNVIKTSVNLSTQGANDEMFGTSSTARRLTHGFISMTNFIIKYTPTSVQKWIGKRFNTDEMTLEEGAAFDQLRASVNLVVAAGLVALGTSLKLPLSTTFVTFMVAMGTSLADRAWGRESAVFRVTGVISVIGGWFITAGAAFILCFLVAIVMKFGGFVAMAALCCLAIFLLVRSNIKFRKKKNDEVKDPLAHIFLNDKDKEKVWESLRTHILESTTKELKFAADFYDNLTDSFIKEDQRALRKLAASSYFQRKENKIIRKKQLLGFKRCEESKVISVGTWVYLCSNHTQQLLFTLLRISEPCKEHVENNFNPLPKDFINELNMLKKELVGGIFKECYTYIKDCQDRKYTDEQKQEKSSEILRMLSEFKKKTTAAGESSVKKFHDTDDDSSINIYFLYQNIIRETYQLADNLKPIIRATKRISAQ